MAEIEFATLGIWSYGLAAVGFAVFAVRLLLGWRAGLVAGLLLGAIVVSCLWAGAAIVVLARPLQTAWLAYTAFDALRYAAWFLFLARLHSGPGGARWKLRANVAIRGLVLLGLVGVVTCIALPYEPPAVSVPQAGARMADFGLRLGLAVLGLVLAEQLFRRADASARWALKPLCIGVAGIFAFDLYFFADALLFGYLDAQIWLARGAANALVIPFIVVATARNPGWTIEMHVSHGAVFHSTAVLVSGAFLMLVAGAGYIARFTGGAWGRALQIEIVFIAFLAGMLVVSSGRFRSWLRVFVSKHFFSYRYDYREEWLRFTRALADATGVRAVQEQAVRALAGLVESPGGAFWLRDDAAQFRPVVRWNLAAPDVAEPADGSLPRFLQSSGWVIDLQEYALEPARYQDLQIPEWLRTLPTAWLVVPLGGGPELMGFVVLAAPRTTVDVNWEVRDLLKVASRQAASYLGQVRATEALVEAQKFDAFNRMSAFVVHDLKNLVAQLTLMLRNAERHRDNPEFQRDMLETVEHVVGRMNQLMMQLRTGATPVEKPRAVHVETLVRAVCRSRVGNAMRLELALDGSLSVVAHEDRLDHVVGHLLQNAIDASGPNERIAVRLQREGDFGVLEIQDWGVGMTAEFIGDRLFKPFETSKTMGMGIGVYESTQYIASLGGDVKYASTPGVGTTVRVRLPLAARDVAIADAGDAS